MKPIAIIGCGGHASVVRSALLALHRTILVSTCMDPTQVDRTMFPWEIMTDGELLSRYSPDQIELVLGIGWTSPNNASSLAQRIVHEFQVKGFRFTGFQHPCVWVAPEAKVDSTAQIHAGAVVQPGAAIGPFALINTKASVDHDCTIGSFCHLAPGVTLSGNVRVGSGCHLGTGASVIHDIEIGAESLIAAGSVVVTSLSPHSRVRGVPAKPFPPQT
ncbi:Putative acetyltransferase EpsM [Pirellula sp. SH-Sr6A]|uniref:acetyltransferase n=1 Tax=Pirellula sp. SH-Sr6A TaxID=1632865 RepID=UPI00078BDFB5|nr:acetyltransferase [Pirellula sp. SH-Sr6A]AMV31855.1 Putative acetyltransferase EpsM [Pirellula sp. SH-Sr6A]